MPNKYLLSDLIYKATVHYKHKEIHNLMPFFLNVFDLRKLINIKAGLWFYYAIHCYNRVERLTLKDTHIKID